ncbi:hypothetical protein H5407_04000 [Mitsuaria sp. WAJ17]|uniref:hypothetical protein n=1 Tax=Mitsuaria sp. WAJ17 TaxID=2761452 RepID=UPI0015FFFCDA|nr:hypothetical protein [Mitsuaria sp. WAJ17]MBB2484384.1 hypothetical protein [Mitsuaria sp. WAJ17]
MQPVEYAPEYTPAERVRWLAVCLVAGGAVVLVGQGWFFPLLRDFAQFAGCRRVAGISGTALLTYGAFVGVPLLSACTIGGLMGVRGYRILRQGRTPPCGEKVFRRTAVVRGFKARAQGWVQVLAATPLLALALWGAFQAKSIVAQAGQRHDRCPDAGHHAASMAREDEAHEPG